jgi:hypothetical protein
VEKKVSVRQGRYQRNLAKKQLHELLRLMRKFNPLADATHFKEEFRKIPLPAMFNKKDPPVHKDIASFNAVLFAVLVATSKGIPPSEKDLRRLVVALRDGGPSRIEFDSKSGTLDVRYDVLSYEHQAADMLLKYVNLSAQCGGSLLHRTCDVCGYLTTGGRGNKKFCSGECRRNFWSYEHQKEYYNQKRQPATKKEK